MLICSLSFKTRQGKDRFGGLFLLQIAAENAAA